jgi:cysteinyl-tRNA synthetase
MDDDFNAARALGVLSDAAHLTNEVLDNKEGYPKNRVASTLSSLYNVFEEMSDVLGIMERDPAQALASFQQSALILRGVDQSEVTRLVCERDAARRAKNFARADTIRTQLWKIGIELMDSPKGTTWNVL